MLRQIATNFLIEIDVSPDADHVTQDYLIGILKKRRNHLKDKLVPENVRFKKESTFYQKDK